MPNDNWYLRVDRRPRRRRTKTKRKERHHTLLAHLKNGWIPERKISKRNRSPKTTSGTRRAHDSPKRQKTRRPQLRKIISTNLKAKTALKLGVPRPNQCIRAP